MAELAAQMKALADTSRERNDRPGRYVRRDVHGQQSGRAGHRILHAASESTAGGDSGGGRDPVEAGPARRESRVRGQHRLIPDLRPPDHRRRTGSAISQSGAGARSKTWSRYVRSDRDRRRAGRIRGRRSRRKLGKKVALVEKKYMGGTCLNVGLHSRQDFSAFLQDFSRTAGRGAAWGARSGRCEFDMPAVVARKNRVVGTLTQRRGRHAEARRRGDDLRAQARLVSRNIVAGGRRNAMRRRNILIATGSRPAVPPIPGIDSGASSIPTRFLTLDPSAGEARHYRRRLHRPRVRLLLSAKLAREVTVFEMLPQIAAGADQEIASRLAADRSERRGVEFKTFLPGGADRGNTVHYVDADGADPQPGGRLRPELHGPGTGGGGTRPGRDRELTSTARASGHPTAARPTCPASGPAAT